MNDTENKHQDIYVTTVQVDTAEAFKEMNMLQESKESNLMEDPTVKVHLLPFKAKSSLK